jgi:hypothetical protein
VTSALFNSSVAKQSLVTSGTALSTAQIQNLVSTATQNKRLLVEASQAGALLNINLASNGASANTSCNLTSSPFPVTTGGIQTSPSSLLSFYTLIYNLAATAAANAGSGTTNPLTVAPAQSTVGNNQYYALAVAAYVWGLSIEQFWEKQSSYYAGAGSVPSIPINSLYLAKTIDTGSSIVSPNTSVLYANGFLDLSQNPYVVTYPQSATYNVLQIMDAYTNVVGSVGSRIDTCGSVVLYYANANYASAVKAAYPNNSLAIYTPQAWLIGRVAVDTYAVQTEGGVPQTQYQTLFGTSTSFLALWNSLNVSSSYSVAPLTNYVGSGTVTQSTAAAANSNYAQFYTNLANAVSKNGLLVNYAGVQNGVLNPSSAVYDQAAMFNNFSTMGLSAIGFSTSGLSSTQISNISTGFSNAISAVKLIATSSQASAANNYWTISTSLGQYDPGQYAGWITSAAVAKVGLGANLAADGTYPELTLDSAGSSLSGANSYTLNFSSAGVPPITPDNGFWSVTIYDSNNNLYNSTTNTYYYTSAVGGVYALGSIQLNQMSNVPTLYFQNVAPRDSALLPYWIPVPNGNFSVVMRLYNPVAANSSGVSTILNPLPPPATNSPQWIPPALAPSSRY